MSGYTENTYVKTKGGSVLITKLTLGHEIACLVVDPITQEKTIEYIKSSVIQHYPSKFDGPFDMYQICEDDIEIKITLNHKMLVRYPNNKEYISVRVENKISQENNNNPSEFGYYVMSENGKEHFITHIGDGDRIYGHDKTDNKTVYRVEVPTDNGMILVSANPDKEYFWC